MKTWKEELADRVDEKLGEEIDVYETQMELKRQGKLEEKIFAESRLRRGVYGQRYDNGHRHDGIRSQQLRYPSAALTKGPETLWDAPGMQRIKVPYGGVTPDQLEVMADLAEEYSSGVVHITTRQDFQLHFVHIEDTPSLMRRLAAAGITTREACGNTVRNVTACWLSGVCREETFDVTPYAKACSKFLLGHPDAQNFGRKFKVAFSGCRGEACGLARMHDIGAIAATRVRNGSEERGFELYVGGGLGAVPQQAKLLEPFLPVEELLPATLAIARIFRRLGEKKNRSRARLKFLVNRLGIDELRRLVAEERNSLPPHSLEDLSAAEAFESPERPLHPAQALNGQRVSAEFREWARTNVYHQSQAHYVTATLTLPLGDISAWQLRRLADIARRFCGDNIRTTVEQNIVLRWVSESDLAELYRALHGIGLADPGAGTIVDVTACPGTDTCKLGIASSRGLGAEIRTRLQSKFLQLDQAVTNLRIKISGCFNSCGQHHVADIGFYGTSRTVAKRKVPHFQVFLGGTRLNNAGAYGLGIGSVPSRAAPQVIERIVERFVAEREQGEPFKAFVERIGKRDLRAMLTEFMKVPDYEQNPGFYSDWGDPREFTLGDMGTGECAGEVVPAIDFDLAVAERLLFEAQLRMDERDFAQADRLSYQAMLQAAAGLVKNESPDLPLSPDRVVTEFKQRFYDTKLFYDRFARGKFANYLFRRHTGPLTGQDHDKVLQRLEETQLFIEASHACYARIVERGIAVASLDRRLALAT